jgi:hypothetical protein
MSEQPSPDSIPAAPAPLPEVVFRMLTPIFRYAIDGATRFTHSGNYRSGRFQIELRPYAPNPTDWAEVTKYADDGIRDMLRQKAIHVSDHFFGIAAHFLLNDVIHPAESITESAGNTPECLVIQDALVDSLRLHSSAGLSFHETCGFRCPPPLHPGLGINTPNTRQTRFCHLGTPSVLRSADFDACRSTIDVLMRKTWNETATFDRMLRLALEYHRLSFTLERVDHAFLILMVVFEAMFKKEAEDNASKAAQRIGRLLGATKRECQGVQKEFNDDPVDSFCKIRNRIAHGDPTLNLATVANKHPLLYRHLTAAIVTLLNLPTGALDDTKDYYDEISRLTESRFFSLPNS